MSIADFREKIQDLPTLPAVANQLNIESQKDTFTAGSLSEIIGKDPPLSAKVLKLSNSAYYGLTRQVTTIDRGVALLGINTIRNLALAVSIFKIVRQGKSAIIDLKSLWHHSLGCAVAAKVVARVKNPQMEEEAFLCGIIHDIGLFAMINMFPEKMEEVLGLMQHNGMRQIDAERKVLGYTHTEAGAVLAESWNFPEKHARGIRFHHNPFVKSIDPDEPNSTLVFAVYAGNQIAKAMDLGMSIAQGEGGIIPEAWKTLGVLVNDLPALKIVIKTDYDNILQNWSLDEA
jgi:putative nucleotidyltransferase with HDIG domain